MLDLDLTPFGFTATESRAYGALLERGPLTGYGLANALSIARANAYQALRALAAKGVVTLSAERPERFRPVQPTVLFARIAERKARELDQLEAALARGPASGGPGTVSISGERALIDLALRTTARARGPVTCVAPAKLLSGLAPAWHKRASEGAETWLWALGDPPATSLPIALAGSVDREQADRYFAAPVTLVVAPEASVIGLSPPSGHFGYWTADPILAGAIRAATDALTTPR